MRKKLDRKKAKEEIELFFREISKKRPKEIKKIKVLARKINFPLKDKRKLFCQNCFTPYLLSKIRIKNHKKIIECKKCKYLSRFKINSS
jgi:RNase P subunit RPR2